MNMQYTFDWSDSAFASKKPIKELQAIFIAAPREISETRFKQLVKTYLPKGNIVLGISKEPYVEGFEDQPQFRMQKPELLQKVIDLVNNSNSGHHIYTLAYFQRELTHLLEKLAFQKVLLINGSWKHTFHTLRAYYTLTKQAIPYEMLSPFISEEEAHAYEARIDEEITNKLDGVTNLQGPFTENELLAIAKKSAARSYDYSFQTGLSLARRRTRSQNKYDLLISTFNLVVPFQTYAMHYGASREKYFSPPRSKTDYRGTKGKTKP
jgi:hypothetical protein